MSDKLKMHSLNKVDDNIKKIGALFPNCVTERKNDAGKVEYAIDFDMLKQELSSVVVEGKEERYQFTWPDKKKSILAANAPISDTLRPCREESVDFDNTQNLYIEGDNLAVLKLLQETYLGKIKMIYIDPPYNTGNDFVYNDDFAESAEEYLAHSGQFDENGNRLVANTESNGRFHTDWLNMIYPRLKLAKDLLTDDGVIFISIDDTEFSNMHKMCVEIFGFDNILGVFVWQKKYGPANDAKGISATHEYIICVGKDANSWEPGLLPRNDEQMKAYQNPDNDPRGVWRASDLSARTYSASCDYPIVGPYGDVFYPPASRSWIVSKENFEKLLADNRITFGTNGKGRPMQKKFITEVKAGITPETWLDRERGGDNKIARYELKDIFPENIFDTPKPSKLICYLSKIANVNCNEIILDFFSGSATTAHAVMQLNAEDGGNRKFIMVQLPEETEEKSEAYKAGYKNICEIGKERIRRAGKKLAEHLYEEKYAIKINGKKISSFTSAFDILEPKEKQIEDIENELQNLDIGFRVLKLDSSNMKDIYYNPNDYEPSLLENLADNIKDDRTPEDLLFQVMLDLGMLLSSKIEETAICGKKVFNVDNGLLYACFDSNVSEETITAIAKKKPYYFVMRDSSMENDSVATNFEQIFATYSPDTVRKVL